MRLAISRWDDLTALAAESGLSVAACAFRLLI